MPDFGFFGADLCCLCSFWEEFGELLVKVYLPMGQSQHPMDLPGDALHFGRGTLRKTAGNQQGGVLDKNCN